MVVEALEALVVLVLLVALVVPVALVLLVAEVLLVALLLLKTVSARLEAVKESCCSHDNENIPHMSIVKRFYDSGENGKRGLQHW